MSLNCHGGYPLSSTVGPKRTRRSGSPITDSDISVSTRSIDISEAAILDRWDISVRVFVRSTRESRPSSEESSRIERCGTGREEKASLAGMRSPSRERGVLGERGPDVGGRSKRIVCALLLGG